MILVPAFVALRRTRLTVERQPTPDEPTSTPTTVPQTLSSCDLNCSPPRGLAAARTSRDWATETIPTKFGLDRHESASGSRGRGGKKLTKGRNPRGWEADVRYVPSSENRSNGASLGNQLSPFCNGTKFKYLFSR